jgi:thiol-disulfide isomerase/thioredoxin
LAVIGIRLLAHPPRNGLPQLAHLEGVHLQSVNRQEVFFPEQPPRPRTLVNFWAPWCEPCRKELPLLNHLARTSSAVRDHRLAVVGIALDARRPVNRFLDQEKLSYPIFIVPRGTAAFMARFHVTLIGLPITLLLNRRNRIIARHLGQLTPRSLATLLTAN